MTQNQVYGKLNNGWMRGRKERHPDGERSVIKMDWWSTQIGWMCFIHAVIHHAIALDID